MLCHLLFQISGCAHPTVLSQLNISNSTCGNVIIDHVSNHDICSKWYVSEGYEFVDKQKMQVCRSRFHRTVFRCMHCSVNSLVKVIRDQIFNSLNFVIFWNLWNWKRTFYGIKYWLHNNLYCIAGKVIMELKLMVGFNITKVKFIKCTVFCVFRIASNNRALSYLTFQHLWGLPTFLAVWYTLEAELYILTNLSCTICQCVCKYQLTSAQI